MIPKLLGLLAFILICLGSFLVFKAFFGNKLGKKTHKKIVIKECIGVFILFIAGLMIIYLYALQPVNPRIIEEILKNSEIEEELPDISYRDAKSLLKNLTFESSL